MIFSRYSTSPKERIVQFTPSYLEDVAERLSVHIKEILEPVQEFLTRHTFDALASYGFDNGISTTSLEDNEESDSLIEELRKIPHPKTEPLQVLQQFLQVLETFGPWCACRSLILLIHSVEKLKVRTPYERHYLLLGALHTRFVIVQKTMLSEFHKYQPIEVLERFSTPKLRAVLDVLRRFDLTHPVEPIRKRPEPKIDEDEDGDAFDADESAIEERQKGKGCGKKKNVKFDNKGKKGGKNNRKRHDKGKKICEDGQEVQSQKEEEVGETEEPKQEETKENKIPGGDVINELAIKEQLQPEPKIVENGIHEGEHDRVNEIELEKVKETVGNLEDKVDETKEELNPPAEQKKSHHRRKPSAHRNRFSKKSKIFHRIDESSLCGIIFVENRFDARILFHYLREASFADPKLLGLNPTIAIDPNPEYAKDSREAEMEHKRREECLKRFRYREANILIGTSLLEEGIELPKANLVIRFDPAKSFRSYLFSKGRAQGFDAEYYAFSTKDCLSHSLRQLSTYKVVEKCLLSRSIIPKPEHHFSEQEWDSLFPKFKSAKLSNAIAIVNRYCARLPSDTFTRLVPLWSIQSVDEKHSCCLRLPINSPVKWIIKGVPMPSVSLAKQAVALQTVMILHSNGELDDSLMPIGKESVRQEPDLYDGDDTVDEDCGEFRPGSTKRRQYYNKQLAPELTKCLPCPKTSAYLYWIKMILSCPLPDEQNTRGRKLHPPENASQCFGIILANPISPLPPFPIYTRCGEVQVQLVRVVVNNESSLQLTEENVERISAFHHYTFTSVLRLDKYLTLFDPMLSENSYYVVPLKKIKFSETEETVAVDWDFVDLIWKEKDTLRPKMKTDEDRKDYEFKPEDYLDAVVMPWYRNHDVPQYFYVAEICENLTPRSQFPGCEFKTFEEYYNKKYTISIQDANQPLLDVDHTSARLNFLTPRYVNRKGMALPTSSESTKKAKRENLEQKQILVPELCAIHPFTASLWRQAVCLPCILYRINCILLANNIRIVVASQVHGLGRPVLPMDFQWGALSFGWTLSDVVAASSNLVAVEEEEKENGPKKKKCKRKLPEESDVKCNGENEGVDNEDKAEPKENGEVENGGEEEELTGFAKAAKEAPSAAMSLAESLLLNEKLLG